MGWVEDEQKRAGWPVEILKYTEGGPSLRDIKSRAKDMSIVVGSRHSPYVGHVEVYLKKGTKKQFCKLLGEFGCNYL